MRHTKVVVTRYGGPEVITVGEQECRVPTPGEIRVKVLAAGVSLPDVLAREGVHPETPRVPYTPGWDLVGMVDQIGEGASGFELAKRLQPCRSAAATHNMFACRCTSSFRPPQVWILQKPSPSS